MSIERQQINLLQLDDAAESVKFSLPILAGISIAFAAALYLFSWQQYTYLEEINNDIATLEKNNIFQAANIKPTADIDRYQSQLKALENQLINKYQIWSGYQQMTFSGKQGFSKNFYHIARLANENLSLYEIDIYNKGKNLSLKGYARKPEYVPIYINELKQQAEFADVIFGDLSIEKLPDHNIMSFSLDKIEEEEEIPLLPLKENIDISDLMNMPLVKKVDISDVLGKSSIANKQDAQYKGEG